MGAGLEPRRFAGDFRRQLLADDDFFDVELHLPFWFRWCADGVHDGEGGAEADGGGGFRIGEDVANRSSGDVGKFLAFLAVEQRAVVLGVGEGVLEREGCYGRQWATVLHGRRPGRRPRYGGAARRGVNDFDLLG